MTIQRNTFEGGANGGAITSTSSAGVSGAALTADAALTFSAAGAWRGGMGARSTADAVAAACRPVTFSSSTARAVMHFRLDTLPAVDFQIMAVYLSTPTTRYASWHIGTDGKMRLSDAGTGDAYTAATALATGTWYRLELVVISGSTTSNGTLIGAYYAAGSTTPIGTYTSSARNTGAAVTYDRVYFGKRTAAALTMDIDELAWDTTGTTLIGPPPAEPPTIVHTETTGLCLLDLTGSTSSDSSSLTYSISPSTGVTEIAEGQFLVPQGSVGADYTVTVTQSGVPYTEVVTVPAAATSLDSIRERVWTGTAWD